MSYFFPSYSSNIKQDCNAMCEASAYLINDGKTQLIMEAVDQVLPEAGGLRLTNIFGDQKFVHAQIDSLSLVEHKIFLKP